MFSNKASHIWPPREGHKIGCIVSIGMGVPLLKPIGDSLFPILEALKVIATDTEDTAQEFADEMAHRSAPDEPRYFRFNVERGLESIRLEEWKSMGQVKIATNNYLRKVKGDVGRCATTIIGDTCLIQQVFYDECHVCFLDVDYREALKRAARIRDLKVPMTAMTATLPMPLENELRTALLMKDATPYQYPTYRTNIEYQVKICSSGRVVSTGIEQCKVIAKDIEKRSGKGII
ncbi:hypothetical protein GP486_005647 [Trichoglossum hirsutum]|uniref:Uncharacterized protein n=1 Tax=Trichoglossum hirsutum TaxID=265104 RepID=A0A9P8L8U8_9PEZI|nr:hypothetical protein GP486_005647 [Trichoglossum hirsutum]